MNQETAKLAALFEKLGAPDPEEWASSQAEEGINQLGRYLFLRQAWRRVVPDGDTAWIYREIEWSAQNRGKPCSGLGPALGRLLEKGVDPLDISDVVRIMQYHLLFDLCYLLGDPGDVEPEVQHMLWALVQIDESGEVLDTIDALHESVLETDPTGREMRPRSSDA